MNTTPKKTQQYPNVDARRASDLSGPVAAAKNRATRNILIAQSKAEMRASLECIEAAVPQKAAKGGKTSAIKEKAIRNKSVRRNKRAKKSKFFNKNMIYSKHYTFPFKLYVILKSAEEDGFDHIISFDSDGTTFVIRNHAMFAKEILPLYFGHSNLRSFDRQCSYWGFTRTNEISNNSYGGVSWAHPKMQRGRDDLVKEVQRVEQKTRNSASKAKAAKRRARAAKKNKTKITRASKKKQAVCNQSHYAKANGDEDEVKNDFLEDVAETQDAIRPVSPVTTFLQEVLATPFPLNSATRRVSDSSLASMRPVATSLPYIPEDSLIDDEDIDLELFPNIKDDISVADVLEGDISVDDPLVANPVFLVDPDDLTDDDCDEVSLLSMQDVDECFEGLDENLDALNSVDLNVIICDGPIAAV